MTLNKCVFKEDPQRTERIPEKNDSLFLSTLGGGGNSKMFFMFTPILGRK